MSLRAVLQGRMPSALEMLKEMVAINSYTENREGVNRLGRLTAEFFSPLGFSAEFVPSTDKRFGNHLALTRRGQSGKSVAMISHLDTVFTPEEETRNKFHWHGEGDRIYGPGTVDIKGGTAMMWLVLMALREQAPKIFDEITWQLFWNASEERLTIDLAELCRNRFTGRPLAALVFEAEGRLGDQKLVVVARKGRGVWRVTVAGRGAHAGGKHSHGANAAVQLGKIVERIAALTNYSRDLTFNVGSISGGTVSNRVPHQAFAEGEFRAFSEAACADAKKSLLSLAGPGDVRSPVDGYACQIKIDMLEETWPWVPNSESEKLLKLWKRAGEDLGIPVGPEHRAGLSDGNLIWDAAPTLDGLGPWGDNDHCSERSADGSKLPEYVEVSSFVPKATLNVLGILNLVENSR